MEQEENKWKVKVDESQKTIKQVFKESLVKKISKSCVNYWKKTKSKQTGSSQRGGFWISSIIISWELVRHAFRPHP